MCECYSFPAGQLAWTGVEQATGWVGWLNRHAVPALLTPEFLAASLNPALLEKNDLLSAAFKHFDCDGDGAISCSDLNMVRGDGPAV